jgi:uncharacterized protein (TIGR03083 family)
VGIDTTAVYRATRERVSALVRGAGDEAGQRVVPACPRWTVRDVVAHLTGVCDDILAGRLDGVATDPWTDAQVARQAGRPVEDILDEWGEVGPRVEELFGPGGAPEQLVFDETTHEHDIRGALHEPGARDDPAVAVALGFVRENFPAAVRAAGAPALTVRSGIGELVLGDGAPAAATLTVSAFDLLRSCTGRRTVDQIAALDWGGADPSPWLPAFTWGPFTPPEAPIEAADAG